MNKYLKFTLLISLIPWLLSCKFSTLPQAICEENFGGKWGTVKRQCILPSCAKTKICGKWASPAQYCQKIQLGQSKDTLRFWLGEPDNEMPNSWQWHASKADGGEILAEFKTDKLVKFSCPK